MSSRLLASAAIVLGVVGALASSPVSAAEANQGQVLILHDDGNSGPYYEQQVSEVPYNVSHQQSKANVVKASSSDCAHPQLILRDTNKGMTAPELICK